jgi:hypothetical protein
MIFERMSPNWWAPGGAQSTESAGPCFNPRAKPIRTQLSYHVPFVLFRPFIRHDLRRLGALPCRRYLHHCI